MHFCHVGAADATGDGFVLWMLLLGIPEVDLNWCLVCKRFRNGVFKDLFRDKSVQFVGSLVFGDGILEESLVNEEESGVIRVGVSLIKESG